jgi:uncharacterized membrane protein YhfC
VSIPLLVVIAVVQLPLMVAFPIVIGLVLKRRYGVGWRIFLFGGATFVASQVVHLPLNYGLGLLSGQWGVALWPLLPMALVAGLSAGVCEQAARWGALRFFLPRVRGWRDALQFGAGHGGIEAIILGLLVISSVVQMVVVQQAGIEALGLGSEESAQAEQMLQAFWSTPLYVPALGGLERVFTVAFHVAMTVLVMRAIVYRQPVYLVAAVAAHTAVDAWTVWAVRTLGLTWTELGLAVVGAASVWLSVRLREENSEPTL